MASKKSRGGKLPAGEMNDPDMMRTLAPNTEKNTYLEDFEKASIFSARLAEALFNLRMDNNDTKFNTNGEDTLAQDEQGQALNVRGTFRATISSVCFLNCFYF